MAEVLIVGVYAKEEWRRGFCCPPNAASLAPCSCTEVSPPPRQYFQASPPPHPASLVLTLYIYRRLHPTPPSPAPPTVSGSVKHTVYTVSMLPSSCLVALPTPPPPTPKKIRNRQSKSCGLKSYLHIGICEWIQRHLSAV